MRDLIQSVGGQLGFVAALWFTWTMIAVLAGYPGWHRRARLPFVVASPHRGRQLLIEISEQFVDDKADRTALDRWLFVLQMAKHTVEAHVNQTSFHLNLATFLGAFTTVFMATQGEEPEIAAGNYVIASGLMLFALQPVFGFGGLRALGLALVMLGCIPTATVALPHPVWVQVLQMTSILVPIGCVVWIVGMFLRRPVIERIATATLCAGAGGIALWDMACLIIERPHSLYTVAYLSSVTGIALMTLALSEIARGAYALGRTG